MDSGLYSAYSALLSRTDALDLAANNLANVSTAGFHAGRSSFRGVLAEAQDSMGSQVGTGVNSFSVTAGAHASELQGAIKSTGNPLDVAISGTAYFAVKTATGTRYTRDGEFQVSAAGLLTTRAGNAVLNAAQQPIAVPSGAIKISTDGTISVAGADGSAIVGQLGLMNVPDAEQAESATLLESGSVVTPAVGSGVQQGALESANQDAIQGTVQLMTIQRQAEMMQRALSVFYNDLDKTASEDLARV
jgi:flagellar basal-body rod protein FlgF